MAIAAVAAIASMVGLPVAMSEARVDTDPQEPLGALRQGLAEVWSTVAVAAAVGGMAIPLNAWSWVVIVVAWSACAMSGRAMRLGAGVFTAVAVLVALTIIGASSLSGWSSTLLEVPGTIDTAALFGVTVPWVSWLGYALVAGFVVAGAGLAVVKNAPGLRPLGAAASVGTGVLTLLAMSLVLADLYESTGALGGILSGLQHPGALLALALVPAVVVSLGVRTGGNRPFRATIGLVATALFLGPAHAALPLWWLGVFPLGIAVSLGLGAWLARGRTRVTLGIGAALMALVPLLSWPDLPGPLATALLALAPVAAVWVAGTRALVRSRPA